MEYRWAGRALTIHVWLPGTVPAGPVAAAVRAAWPGASATIADATDPVPVPSTGNTVRDEGGALAPAMPAWYPLEIDHDTDPTRALVAAGAGLSAGERACVQILARPAAPRRVTQARRAAAALRTGRPPGGGLLDPATWLRGGLNLLTELITPTRSHARGPAGTGGRCHRIRSATTTPARPWTSPWRRSGRSASATPSPPNPAAAPTPTPTRSAGGWSPSPTASPPRTASTPAATGCAAGSWPTRPRCSPAAGSPAGSCCPPTN